MSSDWSEALQVKCQSRLLAEKLSFDWWRADTDGALTGSAEGGRFKARADADPSQWSSVRKDKYNLTADTADKTDQKDGVHE